MPKVKIKRSSRPGKSWMITETHPVTGRSFTRHGGQSKGGKPVRTGKSRSASDRAAFKARHGKESFVQYVNDRLWSNAKIGDTINVPKKYWK